MKRFAVFVLVFACGFAACWVVRDSADIRREVPPHLRISRVQIFRGPVTEEFEIHAGSVSYRDTGKVEAWGEDPQRDAVIAITTPESQITLAATAK